MFLRLIMLVFVIGITLGLAIKHIRESEYILGGIYVATSLSGIFTLFHFISIYILNNSTVNVIIK